MTYRGYVRNGVVNLDEPMDLPDGTEVSIRPLKPGRRPAKAAKKSTTAQPATRRSRRKRSNARDNEPRPTQANPLVKYAGKAKGLPADLARMHDDYLYGVPKK